MQHVSRFVLAALVWLAFAGSAPAQVNTAVLQGTVADADGGVLPGVVVVITDVETGRVREAPADGRGFYRAVALPPGAYRVAAALDGFAPFDRGGVTLTVGQTATVDVVLGVAAVAEVVTVEARAPLVDRTSNALGTTVTSRQLDDLPLAGRNFQGLANLAPGVTGVGGGGINAGGQLSRNNTVVIDGVSNDEQGVAGQRGSLSLEAVREFVVYTNQFAAEHGQASGALVSVVTRSGTNDLRGRAFVFHRDDALDARNPFSKAQGSGEAPFSERRAGGFVGGPVLRDRWHYFGSAEVVRDETTSVVTSPLVPVAEREHPRTGARDQWFGRSEYQAGRAHQVGVRYRVDRGTTLGGGIGGLNPRERGWDQKNTHVDAVATLTSVVSPRAVNELRVLRGTLSTHWTVDGYADPAGVSVTRPSINLGKASNMPQGWSSVRYQVANTLSLTAGRHDLKAGVDIQTDDQDTYFLGNKDGTFLFRTDAPFDPADRATYPFQYTRTIGDWYDHRTNEIYAAFIQDTWRVHDRVTLNLGLRYDTETLFAGAKAVGVAQDRNNVAPRLGVVVTPSADGRTVVRGGVGVYYDQGFNNISGNISNSARSTTVTVVNPGYPDPFDGGTIVATKPSRTVAAPEIRTPSSVTASVGVRRELAPGVAVGLDAVRTVGRDLFNAVDVNAPLPGTTTRPDPDFLRIVQYKTTGESRSNALLVSLERRSGRGPHVHVSYTWSRQERNVEDFGFTAQNAYDPEAEWARANNDRRHQVVASAVWALPWGVQAAALLQARTGLPWTVTTGVDNNGDQNVNDRPDLAVPGGDPTDRATYGRAFAGRSGNLGRNTNTGPAYVQLDARVSKVVRRGRYSVEALVEAFNALNRANLGVPVGVLTSSAFGRPTGLAQGATPRQVELGVRVGF